MRAATPTVLERWGPGLGQSLEERVVRGLERAKSASIGAGMQPSSGMLIDGRYRLDRPLGSGGMGTVWAGEHVLTRRAVALKFVRADSRAPRDAASRLQREARAGTLLSHPHVVDILDMFELAGEGPVLVMSLLEGETLGQRLQRSGPLSLEQTATLLLPVVSALGAAHAKGIVHRDLKPENIFIVVAPGESECVKVLDFGIAKLEREADLRLTESGTVLGTPAYMSPEQATGDPHVDCRTDVWALGVILHECLVGRRPIEGRSIGEHVKLLFTRGVDSIRDSKPDVPRDVADLLDVLLAHHPEARLADLRVAKDVLGRYSSIGVPSFGPPSASALAIDTPASRTESRLAFASAAEATIRSDSAPPRTTEAVPRPPLPQTSLPPQTSVPPWSSLPPAGTTPPARHQSGIFSPSVGAGPQVKGVAFRSSLDAFKRLRGPVAFDAVRPYLPPDFADALDRGLILHSGWYPLEWYSGMFAAMRAGTGEGRELLTALGATSVEIDFRGVYRALLRLISPERLFARSASIFSRYFSAGRYEVVESRPGFVRGRWTDCQGFDANLWAEVIGSSRRMLELAGAKGVVAQVVAGGKDGDDFLEVTGTWTSQRASGGGDPPAQLGQR